MTGNDNFFDMDAATGSAIEFGLALIDSYRDQLRGLADTGRMLVLPDYLAQFGESFDVYAHHMRDDAVRRGASADEAWTIVEFFSAACHQRLEDMKRELRL